jgi:valyl-tRNA synthetase
LKVGGATLYYTDVDFLRDNAVTIKKLARLKDVTDVADGNGMYLTSTRHKAWLDIDASTAKAYVTELEGKVAKQKSVIEQLEKRLANKSYVDNAPKEVVKQTKDGLEEAKEQLATIEEEAKRFKG